MNSLHTSVKVKAIHYHNRELRSLNTKMHFSNLQFDEIFKALDPVSEISQSIARDLGIEMRTSPSQKKQLTSAACLEEILPILSEFTVGQQLQEMLSHISRAEQNIMGYMEKLGEAREKIFAEIKQIDEKTKVNFIKEDVPARPNTTPRKRREKKEKKQEQEREEPSFEALENLAHINANIEKYRRDKGAAANKSIEEKEKKSKEPKRGKAKIENMQGLVSYLLSNQIEEVVNIVEVFTFDAAQCKMDQLMIIIAKTLVFKHPLQIVKGAKKNQLRVFCLEAQAIHYLSIDK